MNLTKKEQNNEVQREEKVESTRGYYYNNPDCDIYENENEFKIVFEIPGIEKDDINVKVEKDVLTITAESRKEPPEGYDGLWSEMDYSGYRRSFNLNNLIDRDKIAADYVDGVLTLTLPKREEQKTKEITIQVS